MEKMNTFETAILNRLADNYPTIKLHLPFIEVKNREVTGVGMFVNFSYRNEPVDLKLIKPLNGAISTNDNIEIQTLEFGLGYEVNISDGKITFMEIITYGEEWDGDVAGFILK